jgi:hypothetical protein
MHSDDLVDEKIAAAQTRVERSGGGPQIFGAREGLALKY